MFEYVVTGAGRTVFHPNGSLVVGTPAIDTIMHLHLLWQVSGLERGDGGEYRCEVQNGVGELSKTVKLTVQGL